MIRKAVATLALVPFLAGCGGGESATPTTVERRSRTSAAETTTTVAAAAGSSAPVAVNATITDPELGHTWKATSVVRNFPVPAQFATRGRSAELVLVKYDVTVDSKYFTTATDSATRIVSSTRDTNTATTSIVTNEMKAAGYTPFVDVKGPKGTGGGWVAYFVEPKGDANLSFRVKRNGFRVSGSSAETIPAKDFDAPLK